jgi:N-acetylglucosamine repressor
MALMNQKDRVGKRTLLLHALRKNPGASRAQIVRELQISTGTVRLLTESLVEAGLLVEQGVDARTGGRPATRLAINASGGLVLGVDLAEIDLRLGLYDLAGNLIESARTPIRSEGGVADVDRVVDEIVAMARSAGDQLRGIGLAVPGQLDLPQGEVVYSANLGWRGVALRERLLKATGVPVFIERNSAAGMLAELWWGDHHDHEVSVYVTMGSGVGASIRRGQDLFGGETGMAGELGHMVVDPGGPACQCGQNGCLETYASTRAIQARFDELRGLTEPRADLLAALKSGDQLALETVREAGRYLAAALTSLVNLLNPGLVILSGQLMADTEHLVEELEGVVRDRALPNSARDVHIVASKLGDQGMLLGAATLVLDALYQGALTEEMTA